MAQQFRVAVSLAIEIRFKRKLGTHKTLSKVISGFNVTVPVEVIEAVDPVGKLTIGTGDDCVLVKSEGSEVI